MNKNVSDYCGLTVDDFQAMALAALPVGRAWPRGRDTVMARFWRGVAQSLVRFHQRACILLRIESDPRLATETLPDWERITGLPDECTGSAQTLPERRLAVIAKLASQGGQTIAFFKALAESLGYPDIEIEEFHPFQFGVSRFGDARWEMGSPAMRFYWRVSVPGARTTWFAFGTGRLGQDPHVRIARAEDLECLFNRLKPAHTHLIFSYEGD